jgi:hypothetical protein
MRPRHRTPRYHGTIEEAPRLVGLCEACGERHAMPDARTTCHDCGREICVRQVGARRWASDGYPQETCVDCSRKEGL